MGEDALRLLFGPRGSQIWRHALGECREAVVPTALNETIRHEHVFACDASDRNTLEGALTLLVHRVAGGMRARGVRSRRGQLALTFSDGTVLTRMVTLHSATDTDREMVGIVREALRSALRRRVRVRAMSLSATILPDGEDRQADLFPEEEGLAMAKALWRDGSRPVAARIHGACCGPVPDAA